MVTRHTGKINTWIFASLLDKIDGTYRLMPKIGYQDS